MTDQPYCSFEVGMKVVCIDGTRYANAPGTGREIMPICEHVYTIREIVVSRFNGKVGLRLREIVNEPVKYRHEGFQEAFFAADRFRRIVDTTDEVAAMKKIVIDAFKGAKVPA